MSYYFQETRLLPDVTLPINCEKQYMSSVSSAEFHEVHLHNHEAMEIIVMQSGNAIWSADTRTYHLSAGDIILINPYVLHSAQPSHNSEAVYLCITFTLNAILGFPNSVLHQCAAAVSDGIYCFDEFFSVNAADTVQIISIANTINYDFHKKTPESECEIMCCLYRLLTHLLEYHYHEDLTFDSYKRNKQFLQKITLYLDENHSKPITSKDAANALFLSHSRFSHVFHQHFGISFPKYLCQYRVHRAAALYVDSALPITEIAAAVGFSDYCYFSRSFKKYLGKSPAVYFGRWKKMESSS